MILYLCVQHMNKYGYIQHITSLRIDIEIYALCTN